MIGILLPEVLRLGYDVVVMKARWVFLCTALLLLFANGAFADGSYQRTKDRKTLVWNSDPQPGEAATWSGKRDENGYATGYGTLTWQTTKQSLLTGSNIPSVKYNVFAKYSGNMVRGKLDGTVTAQAKGRTSHATFVKGRKTSSWVAGPAPKRTQVTAETRTEENAAAEPAPPTAGSSPATTARQSQAVQGDSVVEPDAPAAGPQPDNQQKAARHVSESASRGTPRPDIDDSLRSLVGPPALLRKSAVAEASPQPSVPSTALSSPAAEASSQPSVPPAAASSPAPPQLTSSEVIGLADTEASTQGYDLGEYQLPKPRYVKENGTWSVDYEPKDGYGVAGKHFSISVEDKTKKTSLRDQ